MTGNDLIKAILDQGMGNEELKIAGVNEQGVIDDTVNASITEVIGVEMDDGEIVPSIVVDAGISI